MPTVSGFKNLYPLVLPAEKETWPNFYDSAAFRTFLPHVIDYCDNFFQTVSTESL